mgnify:FL=1
MSPAQARASVKRLSTGLTKMKSKPKPKPKRKSKSKSKRESKSSGGPSVFGTLVKGYFDYHNVADPSLKASRSDKRLKDNIKKIGVESGFNVYSWTWNNIATSKYGLRGDDVGVIAQELPQDAVAIDQHGYFHIKSGTKISAMVNDIKLKYKLP